MSTVISAYVWAKHSYVFNLQSLFLAISTTALLALTLKFFIIKFLKTLFEALDK